MGSDILRWIRRIIGSLGSPPSWLRGRGLAFARVAWVAVAALALGLFVVGLPTEYAHYHDLCADCGCGGSWRLEPDEVGALERLGLSVEGQTTGQLLGERTKRGGQLVQGKLQHLPEQGLDEAL